MSHPTEADEWLEGRVAAWVETYKKAMLTPAILAVVALRPGQTVGEIALELEGTTAWELTERGLYRSLKRLVDQDLLSVTVVPAARTGAKKHLYEITSAGAQLLKQMRSNVVELPNEAPGQQA